MRGPSTLQALSSREVQVAPFEIFPRLDDESSGCMISYVRICPLDLIMGGMNTSPWYD